MEDPDGASNLEPTPNSLAALSETRPAINRILGRQSEASMIYTGLCSWQQENLVKSKKFYRGGRGSDGMSQLEQYANVFPAVEVDSTNYALPTSQRVSQWCSPSQVPSNFVFHFKVLGIFTFGTMPQPALPWEVKQLLADDRPRVSLADLPQQAVELLWKKHFDMFEALAPEQRGTLIFQFQPDFKPTPERVEYVTSCAKRCRGAAVVPVFEFRDRRWYDPSNLPALVAAEAVLSLSDDDGLSTAARVSPVAITDPNVLVVRIHRRSGDDRLLDKEELEAWGHRIIRSLRLMRKFRSSRDSHTSAASRPPPATGPSPSSADRASHGGGVASPPPPKVYIFLGTDAADHSVVNARAIGEAVEHAAAAPSDTPNDSQGQNETWPEVEHVHCAAAGGGVKVLNETAWGQMSKWLKPKQRTLLSMFGSAQKKPSETACAPQADGEPAAKRPPPSAAKPVPGPHTPLDVESVKSDTSSDIVLRSPKEGTTPPVPADSTSQPLSSPDRKTKSPARKTTRPLRSGELPKKRKKP